ncbi:pyridoxamine 5'-phosphate oxidase family protein [Paucibacter sp. R3-3]|uniref:Pyridoxamine 5'-phosphate oxidase family protein n=1 Tax=Roseateles agri TaxID=3098619 RepID=A0ABU5DID0_9BURK|nr:pyridoxamine 5'-phosphate oxidase family protein [Paucibacter sp. R3-3]MDY0744974.1 pyridoxamine 5'-phosphate oxidase family protein [Paucibacter sp. R3-3]
MSGDKPWLDRSHDIEALDALVSLYGEPGEASIMKECDHVHPLYAPYIEAAPFAALATFGAKGLDVSPRGDGPGFVQIADPRHLLLPDRRGNKRVDSLRNVLHDPRVALLFLIPGVPEALRVNGRARISTAPALLERCAHEGILPSSALVIEVALVFFQCARAVKRAGLWDAAVQIPRERLPSPGLILQTLSAAAIDGAAYDGELQERQRRTMY